MNELVAQYQTPIEIALGVDENGMTTARKLYEFLEMEKSNFSRWAKANITNNPFAAENDDFVRFVIDDETPTGGKIEREDYRLTADFAKKLSMTAKNEKGEQARTYFVSVESNAKEAVSKMNDLSPELRLLISMELKQKEQEQRVSKVEERVESIREVVALDTTSWRDDTGSILRKIGMELGGGQAYSQIRSESYELLSKRMGVNLKQRLINKRRRMADEGICKSTRDKLSYVDIIAEDKKLIEGYTSIVKEMAIKYGIGKE